MKTKKLGYVRNGNVLRIAPITDIKQEENEAALFAENMKKQSPLKVRMLPINYASVTDIEGKAKAFLSERGRIIGDARTSSVVISDIEENISRVIKYIQSIDVAPPQVMIEGKVVEASDTFSRDIGVSWFTTGKATEAGTNSAGETIRQKFNVDSKTPITATTFGINYTIGSLDLFGNINARLGLFEREGLVKVLSSPRILAIHNESAEINQTTEVPVVTATATTANGVETKTTTVSYKPVNLKLKVTPLVANTGTVQLNVDVNREFISEKGEISGASYTAVGKRSAVTKVMVRNGQTAVIGGIYQTDTNQTEARVPWLSDIPILGWLFKNRSTNNAKTELMIFLTPRILGQADSQTSSGGEL
jgi:type IV pilus assembly protein PilQ